jgi:hypothetical protein
MLRCTCGCDIANNGQEIRAIQLTQPRERSAQRQRDRLVGQSLQGLLAGLISDLVKNLPVSYSRRMSEGYDGLSIARGRIAEEAEHRTGSLDLGKLGLTELPSELYRLQRVFARMGTGWIAWLYRARHDAGLVVGATQDEPLTVPIICNLPFVQPVEPSIVAGMLYFS